MSSMDKKRARDRRAQQKRRDKLDARVKALELQISLCHEHHRLKRVDELELTVQRLLAENQVLRDRQRQMSALLAGWDVNDRRAVPSPPAAGASHSGERDVSPRMGTSTNTNTNINTNLVRISALLNSPSNDSLLQDDNIGRNEVMASDSAQSTLGPGYRHSNIAIERPKWCDLPLSRADSQTEDYCPWLSCPDVVLAMPDVPLPQDLLYGSITNPVANSISIALREYGHRGIERLASGWLVYVYTKWRLFPTEERYLRIPAFLRPSTTQLTIPHWPMLDNIVFPHLRDNLIKKGPNVDLDPIFMAIATNCVLDYPKDHEYLRPNQEGTLEITPDFYAAFSRLESWSLAETFYVQYSDLMDPEP